jgi:small subunit ribosomal protein S9
MAAKQTTKPAKKTRTKPAKEPEVLKAPEAEIPAIPQSIEEETQEAELARPEVPEAEGEIKERRERTGPEKYYEAVGRRKESVARVRVYTRKSTDTPVSEDKALIIVNGKPYFEHFKDPRLQIIVELPLRKLKSLNRFKATVKVSGGGISGQADAIKHGLSRALVLFDANFSKKLRKAGFLTRDARVKERRKYGLKKARKAPQWAKR